MIVFLMTAVAFTPSNTNWAWQDDPLAYPLDLNTQSFPEAVGTEADIEAGFLVAMAEWNGIADLSLSYGGRTTNAAGSDGYLTATYSAGPAPGNVVATAWSIGFLGGVRSDCDIEFWASNGSGAIDWSLQSSGSGVDFVEVATHEIGHCIGLGHSDVSSAMMWPNVGNGRDLHADDIAGVRHVYGHCSDQDGDGWTDCDGDCDDNNALVVPGATEICDGVDNDCDGLVDAGGSTEHTYGTGDDTTAPTDNGYGSFYEIDRPLVLRRFSQHVDLPEETRVTWTVFVVDPSGLGTRVRMLTEMLPAGTGWIESPALDVDLQPGTLVFLATGVEGASVFYKSWPMPTASGGVTPVGTSYNSWLPGSEDTFTPQTGFQAHQRLLLTDPVDVDGDGVTALCGDCDDEAATTTPGGPEICDGVDNDCDGATDEDTPEDTDADGTIDCLDPCPAEAGDPDGDGICAHDDLCPSSFDPDQADSDGDGVGDVCDPTPDGDPVPEPDEESGGGSCSGSSIDLLGRFVGMIGSGRH